MNDCKYILAYSAAVMSSILWAGVSQAQPAVYLDKLSTPDLTQTDPRGHFAQIGKNYCAPVAVSNSLVWLSRHGFEGLLPGAEDTKQPNALNASAEAKDQILAERQIALVKTLSSPAYMNTRADEGTEVSDVLRGLKKYILQKGYSIKSLGYQGFRLTDPEFDTGYRYPRLSLIKQGITGKSGVWLNTGWYKYKPETDTYVRLGGHWVTLVGYGINASNSPSPDILIVHNPSPLAGLTFHNDFLQLVRINSGVLVSHKGIYGFPRPAAGFYKIVSGLPAIPQCNTAILEGALVLELN